MATSGSPADWAVSGRTGSWDGDGKRGPAPSRVPVRKQGGGLRRWTSHQAVAAVIASMATAIRTGVCLDSAGGERQGPLVRCPTVGHDGQAAGASSGGQGTLQSLDQSLSGKRAVGIPSTA